MKNLYNILFSCIILSNSNSIPVDCTQIITTEPDLTPMLIKRTGPTLVEDFIDDNSHLLNNDNDLNIEEYYE